MLAEARSLAKRAKTKRITERRSALVERAVFFSAYAMRKLDDAKKLSTSWQGRVVKCARHPPIGRRPPNLLNRDKIDKHYDLGRPAIDDMSARNFCDLVIHSFIFGEVINDDRTIAGFYITSDKMKAKGLWFFELDAVVGLMEQTAKDELVAFIGVVNPHTGDAEVWTGDRLPDLDAMVQRAKRQIAAKDRP
jgi:hypothetical protein